MAHGDFIVFVEEFTDVGQTFVMNSDKSIDEGHEIRVNGVLYRVNKLRHDVHPEDTGSNRTLIPWVFVREPLPGQPKPPPSPPRRHKGPNLTRVRSAMVLPFGPSTISGANDNTAQLRPTGSFLFPPSVIASLVVAGYAHQQFEYRRARGPIYLVVEGETNGVTRWGQVAISDPLKLSDAAAHNVTAAYDFGMKHVEGRLPSEWLSGYYTFGVVAETEESYLARRVFRVAGCPRDTA